MRSKCWCRRVRQQEKSTDAEINIYHYSGNVRPGAAALRAGVTVKGFVDRVIQYWDGDTLHSDCKSVIDEEPLSIRIQGQPYAVIMRTPGDETAHAAGFCLAEGIIDTPEDLTTIGVCDGGDANVVTVTLKPARLDMIAPTLDRRSFISQTSCGICGKAVVNDLYQRIAPVPESPRLPAGRALQCLESLSNHQPLRRQTSASHAAALYDAELTLLAAAEDVGRHNALDKAVGTLFLSNRLSEARLAVLSSRISYELVQKAARARLPVVLSYSRPTAIAVALAEKLNMALACLAPNRGLYVFCCSSRLSM